MVNGEQKQKPTWFGIDVEFLVKTALNQGFAVLLLFTGLWVLYTRYDDMIAKFQEGYDRNDLARKQQFDGLNQRFDRLIGIWERDQDIFYRTRHRLEHEGSGGELLKPRVSIMHSFTDPQMTVKDLEPSTDQTGGPATLLLDRSQIGTITKE